LAEGIRVAAAEESDAATALVSSDGSHWIHTIYH
jgi:hypothetical protein